MGVIFLFFSFIDKTFKMLKPFLCVLYTMVVFNVAAQTDAQMNAVQKQLDKYTAEESLAILEKAEEQIDDIFKEKGAFENSRAHFLKAQLMTAQLLNNEYEIESNKDFLEAIKTAYDKGLTEMTNHIQGFFNENPNTYKTYQKWKNKK